MLGLLAAFNPAEPPVHLQVEGAGRMSGGQDPQKPVSGMQAQEVLGGRHEQRR